MKSYTPYENVTAGRPYPPILAMTSLNDTRVLYTEPAKWIAKLQATAAGEQVLARLVDGYAGSGKLVADLFCGVGPFALRLAERARIVAFDAEHGALERSHRGLAVRDRR